MVTNTHSPWGLRLATLALWALAGASVVYWGLRLSAPAAGPAFAPPPAEPIAADPQALARLLGATPVVATPSAAPAASSRFVLLGVLTGTTSGGGAALIAIDGKPARPYRVGATVEPGLVLQSLGRREARLGAALDGAPTLTLEVARKR